MLNGSKHYNKVSGCGEENENNGNFQEKIKKPSSNNANRAMN